jgi:carbonic anhydrase
MREKLLEGFKTFCAEHYDNDHGTMQQLVADGQKPEFFIISCIDSRANPGTIFKPEPGTFFAFKSMGAIVRPYKQGTALAASLQFAFEHMRVPELILIGHTQCGAIKALADDINDPEIASFIDVAKKGLNRAQNAVAKNVSQEVLLREAERQIVLQSIENVKGYPAVAKALAEDRLKIYGWIFDMSAGALLEYNPKTSGFEKISQIHMPHKEGTCCA